MKIRQALGAATPSLSFEFFPPKDDIGFWDLYRTVESLKPLEPDYVSVTSGAGGTTRRKTLDLVVQGTSDRLRAILMTTLTTVVGLLPLAYGIGGSDIYMGPMALALGYGILFATPLTLGLIPCLYMVGDDISRIFTRKPKHA